MTLSGYARPELLASTAWLAEHLHDPGVRVVDMDYPQGYVKAHIPGALGVPHPYLKGEDGRLVMGPEAFQRLMESLGIGDDTVVVAYDNYRSARAARLWWAMSYYGHRTVKVLNGGWRAWVLEGRPIAEGPSAAPVGRATFTPRVERRLLTTVDDLKAEHDRPGVAVWDTRSDEEYVGTNDRGNKRAGHVPGARHLEYVRLVQEPDHTFKSADALRRLLEEAGITPDKKVHTY